MSLPPPATDAEGELVDIALALRFAASELPYRSAKDYRPVWRALRKINTIEPLFVPHELRCVLETTRPVKIASDDVGAFESIHSGSEHSEEIEDFDDDPEEGDYNAEQYFDDGEHERDDIDYEICF